MKTAYPIPVQLTPAEALLEDLRLLILGGILFADEFDQDDLPIAARIAAANDYVGDDEQAFDAGEYPGDPEAPRQRG